MVALLYVRAGEGLLPRINILRGYLDEITAEHLPVMRSELVTAFRKSGDIIRVVQTLQDVCMPKSCQNRYDSDTNECQSEGKQWTNRLHLTALRCKSSAAFQLSVASLCT